VFQRQFSPIEETAAVQMSARKTPNCNFFLSTRTEKQRISSRYLPLMICLLTGYTTSRGSVSDKKKRQPEGWRRKDAEVVE
jgi:hypothetical protein